MRDRLDFTIEAGINSSLKVAGNIRRPSREDGVSIKHGILERFILTS
jgi:hypothetical protein